ncbi:hypothetical protein ACFSHP_13390 [Novosphingobium panipatense]
MIERDHALDPAHEHETGREADAARAAELNGNPGGVPAPAKHPGSRLHSAGQRRDHGELTDRSGGRS